MCLFPRQRFEDVSLFYGAQVSSARNDLNPLYIFLSFPSSTIPSHPVALPAADSMEPRTLDFAGGLLSLCAFGVSAVVLDVSAVARYLCIPHFLDSSLLRVLVYLSALLLYMDMLKELICKCYWVMM